MIPPVQLTIDGTAVRIPHGRAVALALDALALAYAEDPETVGHLLAAHAGAVLCLDMAICHEDTPDHIREMRAAEADGTRDALLDADLDTVLTADDAITLSGRITRLAAHIRHHAAEECP
ncbi:hypothetical protein GT204_07750 [Streptomyces sp. SID4919]|uniref:hypothetical protein n=1 Tax=unclassified Streptomyces TaxID=2593676 RepID=UPI0008239283|nr:MULTISPECIES: hypothetical protein [unclassified Streptomyces]MYY08799.1 hypothetical protein [Streptomyces sp. SID4919]SCK25342.1 hypothetical protein YW7DRAFT_01932 [Streptomyces sp. AmelKG-E11A]